MTIGLAAGMSPGPLQTLVVVSTLQRGFGAGWRVAVAPLLTDAPVVVVGVVVASALPGDALNALAIAGGALVASLGAWTVVTSRRQHDAPATPGAGDLGRGMLVNLASPHPWLFWLTAGGPLVVAGWRTAPLAGGGLPRRLLRVGGREQAGVGGRRRASSWPAACCSWSPGWCS